MNNRQKLNFKFVFYFYTFKDNFKNKFKALNIGIRFPSFTSLLIEFYIIHEQFQVDTHLATASENSDFRFSGVFSSMPRTVSKK